MHRLSTRRRPLPIATRRTCTGIAIGLALIATHAAAALTLDDALRLAQDRSRQLPAQAAAAAASREMAVAAGQRPDPTLKAGINNLPVDGPDRLSLTRDFMTMRSIGVMQEVTRRGKLEARSARFEREAEVADAARRLALANLRRDTATAWLDRHFQERIREVLLRQRDEAQLQVEAADAAYRSARRPQTDVFSARSSLATIEDRIAQVERQILTATTQLARWIGPPATDPLAGLPSMSTVEFHPDDVDTRLIHHPDIAVLVKQEQMAQAEVELARANTKSDISVEVMFSQRGPGYSNMASVNVSIPFQLDQRNRQDREIAARLAVVEQRRGEREETTRMHAAELLATWQEWLSNRDRLTRYDRTLVPLAEERTRASVASYRGGSAPLSAVLEARRLEIDTRLEQLRLEMDTARLWARLNYLVPAVHEDAARTVEPRSTP